MARICIEDPEGNFLYLNVGHAGLADSIVTTIESASNGSARIERELTADELEELGLILHDRKSISPGVGVPS